ncbi:GNAT family N-acetyltransferase [Corallincola spongiicola]|uniref:GNAT family N-acetyltransferase n=1 Tax=Corallincola spongiicola TaxID=2520508 RepID=A0ABY1WKJ7_9GAMM|nr:GNAT family N-acetyltransferase [Corallincola spongiicola]TAA39586.1 GNAT family N-acetyltransferase [Corallincola spongiicola]
MSHPPLFAINSWESEFFSRPIYQITNEGESLEYLPKGGKLLCAKVRASDIDTIDYLHSEGFHFHKGDMDFFVSSRNLSAINKRVNNFLPITSASESDVDSMVNRVGFLYEDSRFSAPYFCRKERDKFYDKWIENAFSKQFDTDFLVCRDITGEVAGFITARKISNLDVRIGLLGVYPKYQGLGVAKNLILTLHDIFSPANLLVATQIENTNAINFYSKLDFKLRSTNYWFYRNDSI